MSNIILLRHGEKYHDTKSYFLDKEGRSRSHRLPSVIMNRFGRPNYIIAKCPIYPTFSFRPIETIYPLALHTSSPIILFDDPRILGDYLIRYINTDYIIVVCWEHSEIPVISQTLGFDRIITWSSTPDRYPIDDDDYNTMIELKFKPIKQYIVHTDIW
jgi:hypothetical protein